MENETINRTERFQWQKGFGAFTVSHSQTDAVRRYIQNQREHHRQRTFEEEFMELLRRHDIAFERAHLFEREYVG